VDICELHRRHLFLYCCIYSALHINGSYPIVACVFVAAGIFLPSRSLATGLHITIRKLSHKSETIFNTFFESEFSLHAMRSPKQFIEVVLTFAPLHRTLRQNRIEMGQNDFNGLIVSVLTKMYINTWMYKCFLSTSYFFINVAFI
jgi:hypothetical protein